MATRRLWQTATDVVMTGSDDGAARGDLPIPG